MPRNLTNPTRSKAIVSDAWNTLKASGPKPTFNYIATVAIVDRMLAAQDIDGRDLSDAIVLGWFNGETPTRASLVANLERVRKGHARHGSYR